MVVLLPSPLLSFVDANGEPYAGGTLSTYIAGTTTAKATWTDPGGTSLNTNPIVLDSAGRCICYGDGAYRLVLQDAVGNIVFDQPSATLVSAAMAPVVGAPDLASARQAMGITDAINAEATLRAQADATETARAEAAEAALGTRIDTIALTPGPPGPAGPSGAAGAHVVQAGGAYTDASGSATVTYPTPFASGVFAVVASSTSPKWWANVTSFNNSSFTVITASPLAGGAWQSGPIGFSWIAYGS